MSLYIAAFIFPYIYISLQVSAAKKTQHDAATKGIHWMDGWMDDIGLVMMGAWFPPNIKLAIQSKEFNFCLIRPENFVSHGRRVLQALFGKIHVGFQVLFTKEWPLYHTGLIAGLMQRWLFW